jgi:hypothetical protein
MSSTDYIVSFDTNSNNKNNDGNNNNSHATSMFSLLNGKSIFGSCSCNCNGARNTLAMQQTHPVQPPHHPVSKFSTTGGDVRIFMPK